VIAPLQKDRNVSKDLRDRVAGYYAYLFMQKKWSDNAEFFHLLPTTLRVDYCYVANKDVFTKV